MLAEMLFSFLLTKPIIICPATSISRIITNDWQTTPNNINTIYMWTIICVYMFKLVCLRILTSINDNVKNR